jgi:hypothetical protein
MSTRFTNVSVIKGRITKNEQRLAQIKNQMLEAAQAPGHVPYAQFKRWERQTRQVRHKIVGLQARLRKLLNSGKPPIPYGPKQSN